MIAIVGSGRVGRALALSLAEGGSRVTVVARSRSSPAIRDARLVLLAVPDQAIAVVARELAALDIKGWDERVVFHHAGALGVEPLAALAARGAAVGVFHPLAAFPHATAHTSGWVRIEGDPRAIRAARSLARRLALRPLSLRARLTASDRALYHAVAALVANDSLALIALGARLLVSLGASPADAEQALAHLAQTAAHNVARDGSVATALTGPVVRGDLATVTRHRRALRKRSAVAADAYAILSRELIEIAKRSGRISPAIARRLRQALGGGRTHGRTV